MPLIVITGRPCTGKTSFAHEIKTFLEEEKKMCVHTVSEHDYVQDKNVVYSDSNMEKEIRGKLKAEVQRRLTKENVIVLDASNYIKGFRYELYCMSKSIQTPQATIHCEAKNKDAWLANEERGKDKYTEEVYNALNMRYETPDAQNRWDSPLFVHIRGEKAASEDIYQALVHRKAPPPNMATQSQPLASSNFLYELDAKTSEIVACIMSTGKISGFSDGITIPGCDEQFVSLRPVTLGKLTHLKRQFISYIKTHPIEANRIASAFIHYLNTNYT